MTDMRRMLGILGEAGRRGPARPRRGLEPMPDLGRLGELVDEVRAAGLPVELRIDGTPRPIDRGRRAVRVPDRPGVAHQRVGARGRRPRRGGRALRARALGWRSSTTAHGPGPQAATRPRR